MSVEVEQYSFEDAMALIAAGSCGLDKPIRDVRAAYGEALRALREADLSASKAHDAIYAEPFDQEAASAAIWGVHNHLRPLIGESG